MKLYRYDKHGLLQGGSEAKADPLETEKRKKIYRAEVAIINRMEGLSGDEKADLISKLTSPEDVFLIPADTTTIAPPKTTGNKVAVFNGKKWSKVVDQRGQVYYYPDKREQFVVEEIGELPEGAVLGKRPVSDEEKWEIVRSKRNGLLADSDWMVLPDSPRVNDNRVNEYRQKLRDLPSEFTDPEKVVFPEMV